MNTLFGYEDTLLKWMALIAVVGIAVSIEKKWKWGAKISSVVMCIFAGMLLANLRILPFESPVYAATNSVLLPLAIPLLLFQSDLRKIIKESGKTFLIFNVVAIGTFLSALLVPIIFANVDNIAEFAAMLGGGTTGGTVNAVALARIFAVPPEMLLALGLVGNFFVGVMIFIFSTLYRTKFFKKNFKYGEAINEGADVEEETGSGITIQSIAQSFAITFLITGASYVIARHVNDAGFPFAVQQIFGNIFLLMTFITTALATLFPKFLSNIKGASELGQLLMLVWFVTRPLAKLKESTDF